jgi:hypothetical protein
LWQKEQAGDPRGIKFFDGCRIFIVPADVVDETLTEGYRGMA